jgi:hypothetical protein
VLPTSTWHWFEFEERVAAFEVCVDAKSTIKAKPGTIHFLKVLDLRGLNRDLGAFSGRKLDSLNEIAGKAKPLKSDLPNARSSISDLALQGSGNPCVFLGFGDSRRLPIPLYTQVKFVWLTTCFLDPNRVMSEKFT